jgi:hypothetical protein
MDDQQDPVRDLREDERRECPGVSRGAPDRSDPHRAVAHDMPIDRVGRSRLIAAIAAVIWDAMAADAESGVRSLPPGEVDAD